MNINTIESLNYYSFPISEEQKKSLDAVFNSIKSSDMIELVIKLRPDASPRTLLIDPNVRVKFEKILEHFRDHYDFDEIDLLVHLKRLKRVLHHDHNIKEFIEFLKKKKMLETFRVWSPDSDIKFGGFKFTDLLNTIVVASLTYSDFIEDTEEFLLDAKKVLLDAEEKLLLEALENDINIEPLLDKYPEECVKNALRAAFNSINSLGMLKFLTNLDCNSPEAHNNEDVCQMLFCIHDGFSLHSGDSVFPCMEELSYLLKYHHCIKEFIGYLKETENLGTLRNLSPSSAIQIRDLNIVVSLGLAYSDIIKDKEQFLLDVKKKLSV
jgi:hypothetical protein